MKTSFGVKVAVKTIALFAIATCCVPFAAAQRGDNDPDMIEVRHYRLTMDKLEKAANATQQVNAALAANPALKKRVDAADDTDLTIDQKVKRFDATFPEAAAIVHRNGLGTREYIMVSLALMNDYMLVGMKKQGTIKEYPPNSVTPENAAFVDANFDKLKVIVDKMTPPDSAN